MSAGKYDIECQQGSDLSLDFTLLKPDGTVQLLTGLSAYMGVKKYHSDKIPMAAYWTSSDGHISITPESGLLELRVSAFETAILDDGGVYDLFVYDPVSGDSAKILEGKFNLDQEVTR